MHVIQLIQFEHFIHNYVNQVIDQKFLLEFFILPRIKVGFKPLANVIFSVAITFKYDSYTVYVNFSNINT